MLQSPASDNNPKRPGALTSIAGIQVAEQPGADQHIARAATGVTAFVGRTLRGPVGRPVSISSFSEYQSIFGGLWQPSTLSYAVEQFFDNGGRSALIVRVVNGGRPPTLTLAAGGERLVLQALEPGTREFLRASVDYDGIGANEPDRFNLVLQRVRTARSEHVEDQEIFRRVSILPDANRYLADALAESQLVRLVSAVPSVRPDRTLGEDGRSLAGYAHSSPDGDDGAPLSDYDIIGSASAGTGLFALQGAEAFNFLCIPPLARELDVGPSALLVAARFCRDKQAMLVVDPPHDWQSAGDALRGMREWELRSENALMYFPRILGFDRLRGRYEQFASCGAVAGMLARGDEHCPVWSPEQPEELLLRPNYRPVCTLSESERQRLAQSGVNILQPVRTLRPVTPRTLAGGNTGAADWKYLPARRLALFIVNSIERATRWVVFESNLPPLRRKVQAQIETFLAELERDGAFASHGARDPWFVICDERFNGPEDVRTGTVNILFGFAAQRAGEHHTYLLTHAPAGSSVRPVSINRLEASRRAAEDSPGESLVQRQAG